MPQRFFSCHDTSIPLLWYKIAREGHFWFEWRFKVFLSQITSLGLDKDLPRKGLDIGCGNGLIGRQLARYTNWSVDGTEIYDEIVHLNDDQQQQTLLYDIQECHDEFREKYDFLVLFDILEHIEDTASFLHAAIYHLKPGGWIFINVPAIRQMYSAYDVIVKHIRRYDKAMMRAEMVGNNLRIRDIRYWGMALLPLLALRRYLPYTNDESQGSVLIERGCNAPTPFINKGLLRIMQIETALCAPPIGTSLITAIEKLRV